MTDLSTLGCREFVQALSEKTPVPGGGAAAAMTAAMGMALCNMVAEYTIDKKGYEDVQDEVKEILEKGKALQAQLLDLIQADADAFTALREAMAAPAETEADKTARVEKLSDASKVANRPAIDITKAALKGVRLAKRLAEIGNKYVLTDVAAGANMLHAAMEACYQNIMVNMRNVLDFDYMDTYKHFSKHS